MSIEAGVLVDMSGRPIYWHSPKDASAGGLPDSANLWDVIWTNRKILAGFAHTHPGSGMPSPSSTDVTTFAAIEAGLGTRLSWWILSKDQGISVFWSNLKQDYVRVPWIMKEELVASWVFELRKISRF